MYKMVSNWLLRQREHWIYDKLKKEFSDKEIEKLQITITDNSFSYMQSKNKNDFEGMTIKYPNILLLLIRSLKNEKNIKFERLSAKSKDMMVTLPSLNNKEHYAYHLKIKGR